MAAPPKEGATFTPVEIEQMGRALEIALQTITREDSAHAMAPDGELRRRLAALIFSEAGNGRVEAERLARIAVRSLRLASAALWSA